MKARNLLLVSLAGVAAVALPATPAHALLVKVSINFGPTITGPDDGTLIVTANPGDTLRITWALGTDTSIDVYRGLIFGVDGVSEVDTTEISRVVGSALELMARDSTRAEIRTFPMGSSATSRGRTGLPPASPVTMVNCGGWSTS